MRHAGYVLSEIINGFAWCFLIDFAECPEPISNPPYKPNTVVISRELQGVAGLTYFSISTCGKGFILIGSAERRCNASGKWTGETPICYSMDKF